MFITPKASSWLTQKFGPSHTNNLQSLTPPRIRKSPIWRGKPVENQSSIITTRLQASLIRVKTLYIDIILNGMTKEKAKNFHQYCTKFRHSIRGRKLLSKIAKLPQVLSWRNKRGNTLLEDAILKNKNNSIDIIGKYELQQYLPKEELKTSILHFCIDNNKPKALKRLLCIAPTSALSVTNMEGETAFEYALEKGDEQSALLLLKNISNLSSIIQNQSQRFYTYVRCIQKGRNNLFKKMLELRDCPIADNWGRTLRFFSIFYRNKIAEQAVIGRGITSYWLEHTLRKGQLHIMLSQIAGKKSRKLIKPDERGCSEDDMYPSMAGLWRNFDLARFKGQLFTPNKLDGWKRAIHNAINMAISDDSPASIVSRIQAQSAPVIINTGYNKHSIVVVFHKELMFICNRGNMPLELFNKKAFLIARKINPKAITEDSIATLIDMAFREKQISLRYIYSTFLKEVKAQRIEALDTMIYEACPLSPQSIGNCVITSLKTGILASLIGYLWPSKITKENMSTCYQIYKAFSQFSKLRIMNTYKRLTSSGNT